jgi:hypothetical protein
MFISRRSCLVLFAACLAPLAAHALDIPMNPALAADLLDSKTCFAVLKSGGRLLGYDLSEQLIVSSDGRLTELPEMGRSEIGDGRRRIYSNGRTVIVISPIRIRRTGTEQDFEFVIDEKALAVVIDGDRRQRLTIDVKLLCSP